MVSNCNLRIGGLEKYSLSDYPGMVSAVVFVTGCNLSCWYCHNKQLLDMDTTYDTHEVLAFLDKRRDVLDGVVVTGGEPTLQEGLTDFLQALREMEYYIKLDTNGMRPDVVRDVIDRHLADYVAVDYKAPLRLYEYITGHNGLPVLQTIELFKALSVPFEVRTTMIPVIGEYELREMRAELNSVPLWFLQVYRSLNGGGTRSVSELELLADTIRTNSQKVFVRA